MTDIFSSQPGSIELVATVPIRQIDLLKTIEGQLEAKLPRGCFHIDFSDFSPKRLVERERGQMRDQRVHITRSEQKSIPSVCYAALQRSDVCNDHGKPTRHRFEDRHCRRVGLRGRDQDIRTPQQIWNLAVRYDACEDDTIANAEFLGLKFQPFSEATATDKEQTNLNSGFPKTGHGGQQSSMVKQWLQITSADNSDLSVSSWFGSPRPERVGIDSKKAREELGFRVTKAGQQVHHIWAVHDDLVDHCAKGGVAKSESRVVGDPWKSRLC